VSLLNYTRFFRPLNFPFSQKSVLSIVHYLFHVACPLPTLFLITLYYDSFSNRMLHVWSLDIIQWLTEKLHLLWPHHPGILTFHNPYFTFKHENRFCIQLILYGNLLHYFLSSLAFKVMVRNRTQHNGCTETCYEFCIY
jgi:hypothetical protein